MKLTVRKLNDADRGVDYSVVLKGHVVPRDSHGNEIEVTYLQGARDYFESDILKFEVTESHVQDMMGNTYVVFTTRLEDGEIYASAVWLGFEKWSDKGQRELILTRQWKKFKVFDKDLRDYLRNLAEIDFGRANLELMKVKYTLQEAGRIVPARN